ncbi:glycine cleavage system protein H [Candidatus Wirthbacteria bacterium CG2_30_54_11]|uniref:Glycine cleavage system H protein n=1 Tax=Candidatus Wirthbacteria bacterium CG2_30_54_11 TaxID=1817892 RepID=A0A1J5INJ2_9BACT|nr:MAG: glycine cleavage system protein H [Candidatus Wirthbacteria bacterium CG2_30_54_11]
MSKPNPTDLKYTNEHEWAKDNGDGTVTMGITDHAQHLLTDIVYVELPALGKQVVQGKQAAVVESVKSVSDVYAAVSGEVIEANTALEGSPETVNQDAFVAGWIMKIKMSAPAELGNLMDAAAYDAFIAESH